MSEWKNYYAILGVAPDAGRANIRAARNRKALDLHPDRLPTLLVAWGGRPKKR